MAPADVLIVGAGQAGAQTALSLRLGGHAGSILMVGDEPDAPYERPPLSKDYLAGERDAARLYLRPAGFWAERNIALQTHAHVVSIDATAHTATLETGETIAYRALVWAAGGHPRPLPLPGATLAGVHMLRTRADADRLRAELADAIRVCVIGGGYIGLEAAAVLAKAGRPVTVLEVQDRVLARMSAEPISRHIEAQHRAHGVDVRTGVTITAVEGREGRVMGVALGDGTLVPADIVIAGIGLLPNQAVLTAAGAECGNGVLVDEFCRTSLPDIYAIGDCANHPNAYAGGMRVRLESVQNAIDQAKTVASVLLGTPQPYRALPWFWSNQYDLKLQTVGLNHGYDDTVLRGDPATGSFSLIYLRAGRVVALDTINALRDFNAGKKLVELGACPDRAALADLTVPLKSLAEPS
ncbi:MAG: FAD-dependent oxidoreductase [Azospirillaceae bacterium]|nr:FAD-dependent oxidoreductase [Azospirillaceae bacterium]